MDGIYDAIRNAGLKLPDRPRASDLKGKVVNCFIKCEADRTRGCAAGDRSCSTIPMCIIIAIQRPRSARWRRPRSATPQSSCRSMPCIKARRVAGRSSRSSISESNIGIRAFGFPQKRRNQMNKAFFSDLLSALANRARNWRGLAGRHQVAPRCATNCCRGAERRPAWRSGTPSSTIIRTLTKPGVFYSSRCWRSNSAPTDLDAAERRGCLAKRRCQRFSFHFSFEPRRQELFRWLKSGTGWRQRAGADARAPALVPEFAHRLGHRR